MLKVDQAAVASSYAELLAEANSRLATHAAAVKSISAELDKACADRDKAIKKAAELESKLKALEEQASAKDAEEAELDNLLRSETPTQVME